MKISDALVIWICGILGAIIAVLLALIVLYGGSVFMNALCNAYYPRCIP